MQKTKTYRVADHLFAVTADDNCFDHMKQYAPFETADDSDRVFCLTVAQDEAYPNVEVTIETSQDDEGSQIIAGRTTDGRNYIEFQLRGSRSARMLTTSDYTSATVWLEKNRLFGLNNAIMVLYAMATARKGTALFHAAVVGRGGRAYMFLGKSGTGTSTHASLWVRYLSGAELVNDDNPVVRVFDDRIMVYGSPWSGKTPCYRNMSLPLGAIVQLRQAPRNEIRRLRGIEAYASLVPSISGKRWDRSVADGLHETENALAGRAPMWFLDCLPDEAAAVLCSTTVEEAHD